MVLGVSVVFALDFQQSFRDECLTQCPLHAGGVPQFLGPPVAFCANGAFLGSPANGCLRLAGGWLQKRRGQVPASSLAAQPSCCL